MTRYRTIVADPPWPYPEGFCAPGAGHFGKRTPEERGSVKTDLPYGAMSLDEIKALPVRGLADRNARLFLWTTMRYLVDGFDVVKAWGFAYRQLVVWDKTPHVPPFGGSVAPNAAEFLIVAAKGSPPVAARWKSSVIRARKPRTVHSAKPDVFIDLVETVSPGPYLEMFARRARFGWDYWGDQSLGTAEMVA
jgi:N6-adenosine-specific RNA methylase IME4